MLLVVSTFASYELSILLSYRSCKFSIYTVVIGLGFLANSFVDECLTSTDLTPPCACATM